VLGQDCPVFASLTRNSEGGRAGALAYFLILSLQKRGSLEAFPPPSRIPKVGGIIAVGPRCLAVGALLEGV